MRTSGEEEALSLFAIALLAREWKGERPGLSTG
jgi:hypothetical protein